MNSQVCARIDQTGGSLAGVLECQQAPFLNLKEKFSPLFFEVELYAYLHLDYGNGITICSIPAAIREGIFEVHRVARGKLNERRSDFTVWKMKSKFTESEDSLVCDGLTSTNHIPDVAFGHLVVTDIES